MDEHGSLIPGCLSSKVLMAEIGSARSGSGKAGREFLFRRTSLPAFFALMSILSACSSGTPYPDLGSVAPSEETASALEQRRQIVRDLIEDRDLARHNEAVVRHRSGLSDSPPPAAPASTATRAEDIVRQLPLDADLPAGQALQTETERAYRDRAQFDDGTLNDFIRNLKKDTTPDVVEQPPDDQERLPGQPEGLPPQSWLFEELPPDRLAGVVPSRAISDRPVILAAFAPSALREEGMMAIRLAADDAQSGFFCSYLGWMVAWSDACLEEGGEGGAPEESGGIVSGDDGDASGDQPPLAGTDEPAAGGTGTKDLGREVVEPRRSQPDDEVVASEDVDSSGSSLIAGPLDRLRNLLRSRSPRSEPSSTEPRSLSYEAEALRLPKDLGPPLPRSRPEVEKDLRIVRNDNVFEFTRTPRPAFKPVQMVHNTVIFPPPTPRQAKKSAPLPAAKPELAAAGQRTVDEAARGGPPAARQDVAVLKDLDQAKTGGASGGGSATGVDEAKTPKLPDQPPKTAIPGIAEPEDPTLLDSEIITFAPGSADLPVGLKGRLGSMLRKAKAKDGKLYIVSEAEIGSLAMERARGIGLALVHLGATADLIEYDIVTAKDSDQVILQLKLGAETILEKTDASDP